MPKERITPQTSVKVRQGSTTPGDTGQEYDVFEPSVLLTWRTSSEGAGHVQFCVEVDAADMLKKAQVAQGDSHLMEGWGPPMNRGQINHLIRVLRRARDGAFGADA